MPKKSERINCNNFKNIHESDLDMYFKLFTQVAGKGARRGKDEPTIDVQEFSTLLRISGGNPTDDYASNMFNKLDTDNSGALNFKEYLTGLDEMLDIDEEMVMRKAFMIFDKDGSGSIDGKELRAALALTGQQMSKNEVKEMIAMADIDGDGKINYEEFIKMMTPD